MEEQYLQVHWLDGMKINKSHFISQENAFNFQSALGLSSLLNDFNYGLLPLPGKPLPAARLYLRTDNQNEIFLRIDHCRAVTRGGHSILIDAQNFVDGNQATEGSIEVSVAFQELKEPAYYVVLCVNPYKRMSVGLADARELPPRQPFTRPSLSLHLMPANDTIKDVVGLYHIPVGLLRVDTLRVSLDESYVPPCATIGSDYSLLELQAQVQQFYAGMEKYVLQIIQKILQKRQVNDLASMVQKICEQVSISLSMQSGSLNAMVSQPPFLLFEKVSAFARVLKNSFDYFTGTGKEDLMTYCTEWCNVAKGELESAAMALINSRYDHLNAREIITRTMTFMKITLALFDSLDRLEYIGKRRDPAIFVKENLIIEEVEEPRRRRSFLAE